MGLLCFLRVQEEEEEEKVFEEEGPGSRAWVSGTPQLLTAPEGDMGGDMALEPTWGWQVPLLPC